MNILAQEDLVKGLPDQVLIQDAEAPTGEIPQFLVVSEIGRRQKMRQSLSERVPEETVTEQIVQQGIASLNPSPDPLMNAAMGAPAPMMQDPMMGQDPMMAQMQDPMMQQKLQMDPEGAKVQINAMIAQKVAQLTMELAQSEAMGQQQDPLVALKQQELDIKALDLQRKSDQDMMSNELREDEVEEKLDMEKMKLESSEDQAAERIRIADQKLKQTRDIAEARLQVEKMKRTAEDRRTKEQGKKK